MALLGLRHLALRVADPQASKRFYRDCFEMSVVWEPDPDNVYLSSGVDNLALHRAPGVAPGALDHLGFIVGSKQDVDRLAARFRARGVCIAAEPRDHRDGSRSFYCLDPDGLRIQVLYEPTLSHQTIRQGRRRRLRPLTHRALPEQTHRTVSSILDGNKRAGVPARNRSWRSKMEDDKPMGSPEPPAPQPTSQFPPPPPAFSPVPAAPAAPARKKSSGKKKTGKKKAGKKKPAKKAARKKPARKKAVKKAKKAARKPARKAKKAAKKARKAAKKAAKAKKGKKSRKR